MDQYESGRPRVHRSSSSPEITSAIKEYTEKLRSGSLAGDKDFFDGLIKDLEEELKLREEIQ